MNSYSYSDKHSLLMICTPKVPKAKEEKSGAQIVRTPG